MAKNKAPKDAWEYATWLLESGRLTSEEYRQLELLLIQLEEDSIDFGVRGC